MFELVVEDRVEMEGVLRWREKESEIRPVARVDFPRQQAWGAGTPGGLEDSTSRISITYPPASHLPL